MYISSFEHASHKASWDRAGPLLLTQVNPPKFALRSLSSHVKKQFASLKLLTTNSCFNHHQQGHHRITPVTGAPRRCCFVFTRVFHILWPVSHLILFSAYSHFPFQLHQTIYYFNPSELYPRRVLWWSSFLAYSEWKTVLFIRPRIRYVSFWGHLGIFASHGDDLVVDFVPVTITTAWATKT